MQLVFCAAALAADISVIGVFPGKGAVLVVDSGGPQSIRIGQKIGAITLISVDKTAAIVDDAGRRRAIPLGQHMAGAAPPNQATLITLVADPAGHFLAEGSVNGAPVRFLVDTGATVVAIPGKAARAMGIDLTRAERATAMTANGPAPAYRVKLDSVKLGAIELLNVDAVILDGGGLTQPLLGMSFLSRLDMRREGDSMTLKRRF
ncbi:MAG: TIGR02281 family clan AA aspartic protease [Betaproteobacteria bacterium]